MIKDILIGQAYINSLYDEQKDPKFVKRFTKAKAVIIFLKNIVNNKIFTKFQNWDKNY